MKYASAILAYAISVGLAGAVVRNSRPVTVYLPIDAALEPHWATKIEAILGGKKRLLVDLLRAHLIPADAATESGSAPPIGTKIKSAKIVSGPIAAGPHTIYLIDQVLGLECTENPTERAGTC